MEALLLAVMGVTNVVCFVIGARVGQKVVKGEAVELPTPSTIGVIMEQRIREQKDKKQAEFEQDRLETIMRNIEGYDGTGIGQEDVPRG